MAGWCAAERVCNKQQDRQKLEAYSCGNSKSVMSEGMLLLVCL